MSIPVRVPSDVVDTNCLVTDPKIPLDHSINGLVSSTTSSVINPISLNTLNPANPKRTTTSMNRMKYPMNDGEESGDDDDDESDSESDDVYVFLTSSGNHDDTGGTFVDAVDDDAADDESVDDDDFASFLENMLNIELEADAGGFEFANDIFGCLLLLKNAKYYYIILFKYNKYNNILYKNKLNTDLYI